MSGSVKKYDNLATRRKSARATVEALAVVHVFV